MKRVLLALLFVAGMALPAQAHHGDVDAFWDAGPYDAATWNQSVSEEVCITSEFEDYGLSPAQIVNVQDSVRAGFGEWRAHTDITKLIDFGGDGVFECLGNMNFRAAYENAQVGKSFGESIREDFCEHRGNQSSSIQFEDLGWLDNRIAMSWTCDTDNNGLIDYVIIIVDPRGNYNYNPNTGVGVGNYDFPGIMVHEAGHGYGFALHWANDTETCPNNSNHNTMCSDEYGNLYGAGGTEDRTIESHDIGEVNQAY